MPDLLSREQIHVLQAPGLLQDVLLIPILSTGGTYLIKVIRGDSSPESSVEI